MSFTPNSSRTIKLPLMTATSPNLVLQFPAKSPLQLLDYTLDISAMLAAEGGDNVASVSAAVFGPSGDETPLTIAAQPTPGTLLTAMLSSGTLNTMYSVRFTFITDSAPSRTYVYDVWIAVVNLASSQMSVPIVGVGPQGPQGSNTLVAGEKITWGANDATGIFLTQRISDGAFVVGRGDGLILASLDLNGNLIVLGGSSTNATP